ATLGRRDRGSGTTICISGISENEKKTRIQEALGDFGHIVRIEIPGGRRVAFVEFEDKRDAMEAMNSMDRKMIGSSNVTIRLADDRAPGASGAPDDRKPREQQRGSFPAPQRSDRSRSRSRGGGGANASRRDNGGDRGSGRGGDRGDRGDRGRSRDRGRDRDRDRDR
ncbi:unnamed protein product, partial [Polarella glacialis]